jgi:hypothetical protein
MKKTFVFFEGYIKTGDIAQVQVLPSNDERLES